MMYPGDTLVGVPRETWDIVVTWAVCEGLRSMGDNRLSDYEKKLEYQQTLIINSINTRQSKEPVFVTGFMESDYW
jgi:hypothetical protein